MNKWGALLLVLLFLSGCVSLNQIVVEDSAINSSESLLVEKDFVQELGEVNSELLISISDI